MTAFSFLALSFTNILSDRYSHMLGRGLTQGLFEGGASSRICGSLFSNWFIVSRVFDILLFLSVTHFYF